MTKTQRFTLAATSLGLFMIYLDALIVNVALPAIQSDFKVGEAGLQWVVTAYSLGMTIAIMSSGTAADIYGRRKLYLSGIALFTAASAACGMASSVEALNFARAVQGVAAATVNVTSLALVNAAFPDPKLKSWAIGIWTAIASTAIAIGPTLGGFMVQGTGWRSIFMVNIPVGLVAMALTWRFVAESRDERPRTFDIPGQLLFMTAVGAFAFAVIEGPHAGWLSGKILTLFVVAGAARRSNQVWVSDATAVLTAQGWLYLVAVLDLFTRRVVGWAMNQILDAALVISALRMALGQRPPTRNRILHSDRGAQFASAAYRQVLAQHGLVASMSRKGNCYDNAFIESFFSSLKYELVYHHRFATHAQARTAIFDYIETFYNRTRLHSSLDYQSPTNFESQLNPNYPYPTVRENRASPD